MGVKTIAVGEREMKLNSIYKNKWGYLAKKWWVWGLVDGELSRGYIKGRENSC